MRTTIVAGFGIGLAAAACGPDIVRELNSDHCANQSGNDWCRERYGAERGFCVWGTCGPTAAQDGCAEVRPAEDECYSPCGAGGTVLDDASCLGSASSSGTDTGTGTGETTEGSGSSGSSTTGPMPCVDDQDCPDAAAPFCEPVSGECVRCDGVKDPDGACAELDPMAPLCVEGDCVQCTAAAPEACMGTTPVCDDASNTCVPCTEHGQCGEAACNLYTGACLPGDAVVHVGPRQDFETLGEAVSSFAPTAEGTIVVHQANYDEAITVDGGRVLAFLAYADDTPLWILAGGGAPQLAVTDGTVFLDGLRLSSNADDRGLVVNGGRAWVDRARIVQNSGGGVLAQAGAELTLRNCFVGGPIDGDAVAVNASTLDMLYTTAGAGPVAVGRTRAVFCDDGLQVEARNSILLSLDDDPEVECPGVTLVDSATEAEVGFDAMWFTNYVNGDFHLTPAGADIFDGLAEWRSGDPSTDIDGQPRPAVDPSPDYAGADIQ